MPASAAFQKADAAFTTNTSVFFSAACALPTNASIAAIATPESIAFLIPVSSTGLGGRCYHVPARPTPDNNLLNLSTRGLLARQESLLAVLSRDATLSRKSARGEWEERLNVGKR